MNEMKMKVEYASTENASTIDTLIYFNIFIFIYFLLQLIE